MEQPGGSGSLTGTVGEEREKEKRRWVDLFDRESHRQFYLEYLRDQHYEDIITTLRRSVSAQEGHHHHHKNVADKDDGVDDDLTVHSAPSFHHLRIPPEQYFLTPDPALHAFYGPTFLTSGLATGRGGVFGGRAGPFATATSSATTFSSTTTTVSELSLAASSTLATSGPAASRKWLPPEVVAEKQRSRRRRTAVYVCFGVLSLAVAALTIGVVLHFLLETGKDPKLPPAMVDSDDPESSHVTRRPAQAHPDNDPESRFHGNPKPYSPTRLPVTPANFTSIITVKSVVTTPLVTTSTLPVATSTLPVTTSTLSVTTSTTPMTTVTLPVATSTPPMTTSTLPMTTSTLPVTTSTLSVTTSSTPMTTVTLPVATSTPPMTTSTLPVTTSTLPVTTSTLPVTTSTLPLTTSTLPMTTSTLPVTTSTLPVTTSTLPMTTSTLPVTTSTLPVTTSTLPLTMSTLPMTTSSLPVTTSTLPMTTSTLPMTTSTLPMTTSIPPVTTSTSPVTTSTTNGLISVALLLSTPAAVPFLSTTSSEAPSSTTETTWPVTSWTLPGSTAEGTTSTKAQPITSTTNASTVGYNLTTTSSPSSTVEDSIATRPPPFTSARTDLKSLESKSGPLHSTEWATSGEAAITTTEFTSVAFLEPSESTETPISEGTATQTMNTKVTLSPPSRQPVQTLAPPLWTTPSSNFSTAPTDSLPSPTPHPLLTTSSTSPSPTVLGTTDVAATSWSRMTTETFMASSAMDTTLLTTSDATPNTAEGSAPQPYPETNTSIDSYALTSHQTQAVIPAESSTDSTLSDFKTTYERTRNFPLNISTQQSPIGTSTGTISKTSFSEETSTHGISTTLLPGETSMDSLSSIKPPDQTSTESAAVPPSETSTSSSTSGRTPVGVVTQSTPSLLQAQSSTEIHEKILGSTQITTNKSIELSSFETSVAFLLSTAANANFTSDASVSTTINTTAQPSNTTEATTTAADATTTTTTTTPAPPPIPATLPMLELTPLDQNDNVSASEMSPEASDLVPLDPFEIDMEDNSAQPTQYFNETDFNKTVNQVLKAMTSSWLSGPKRSPPPSHENTTTSLATAGDNATHSPVSLFSDLLAENMNDTVPLPGRVSYQSATAPPSTTVPSLTAASLGRTPLTVLDNVEGSGVDQEAFQPIPFVPLPPPSATTTSTATTTPRARPRARSRPTTYGPFALGRNLGWAMVSTTKASTATTRAAASPGGEEVTTPAIRARGPLLDFGEPNPLSRRPPVRLPTARDPSGFSAGQGPGGDDLFAFPRQGKEGDQKTSTTRRTTTTTAPSTTTTTEKPAEVIIIAPDVVAELGMSPTNNLKVTCHAFQAWGWSYMALYRYEGSGHVADAVEFLGGVYIKDEFPFIPIDSRMSHHRIHRDNDRVSLTLESQYAVCEDGGTYLCEITVNGSVWSKNFNVDVRKKPDTPVLTIPDDIISGEEVTFKTTWNAGAPLMGTIVQEILSGYTGLPNHISNEKTITKQHKCEVILENSYTVRPDISWNGTEILVSILPKKEAPPRVQQRLLMLEKEVVTLSVLKNDTCVGNENRILPHPYTCTKYINCNFGIIKVERCPDKKCFHKLQLACY